MAIKPSRKFIWLFGENLGKTMNNNSWYSFLRVANEDEFSDIDMYFIATSTARNRKAVHNMPQSIKDRIVWRNSIQHQSLYRRADMFFVTLSYRDILPDKFGENNKYPKPTVYLQHGVIGIKKVGYKPDSYKNTMWRFLCFTQNEIDLMHEYNGFREYQLELCPAMPRWQELVRLDRKYKKQGDQKSILWFITWRDYLKDKKFNVDVFLKKIVDVLSDERLHKYLDSKNLKMTVCLHQLFDIGRLRSILGSSINNYVDVVYQSDIDIMDELAKAKFVITDYSSIGFDATFLGKPVLLYQFDRTMYLRKRSVYVDVYEDIKNNYCSAQDLVRGIVGRHRLNAFYRSRLSRVDMDKVEDGYYTLRLFRRFANSQRNKVVFLGYNFYGRGGTVTATKSLAEGLLEKGYLVELYSLKKNRQKPDLPPGLPLYNFYAGGKSISSKLKRLVKTGKYLGSLNYDINKNLLVPYCGLALGRFVNNTNAYTIVSTRETIHPFLADTNNANIVNKIFFFHTSPKVIEDFYPGIMKVIRQKAIGKVAFVTESSRQGYSEIFNFSSYDKHVITGNALQRSDVVQLEDIMSIDKQDDEDGMLHGLVLMRLSPDRIDDINNMLEFARYLKKINAKDVVIDLFGTGDSVNNVIERLDNEDLGKYIRYRGLTTHPYYQIREHDFLVDFSVNHTFGMIYIEAILNGKMCFAASNEGSRDVLKGIDGAIYESWKDLLAKIRNVPNISTETLRANYAKIEAKYGRSVVASRFEKLLDRKIEENK